MYTYVHQKFFQDLEQKQQRLGCLEILQVSMSAFHVCQHLSFIAFLETLQSNSDSQNLNLILFLSLNVISQFDIKCQSSQSGIEV